MRIGVDATSVRPGHSAGIEAFTYGLLNGLADGPHELIVHVLHGTGDEWRQRVPSERIGWSQVRTPLRTDNRIGRLLRRHTPRSAVTSVALRRTVNLVRQWNRSPAAGVDVTIYPFAAVPVHAEPSVIVLHDLRQLQPGLGSPGFAEVIRRNVAAAAAVVVSWPHPYEQAVRAFPEARDKIAMIPLPAFHAARQLPPTEPEPGLLVFPSSTAPLKNHATLLEAMALLPECRVVCPGPLVEPEASRLLARAARPDLRGRVSFPGFVSTEELASLYSRASAVVVPSLWEAASGAMLEAFSWGLPVACADSEPLLAQLEFTGADAAVFAAQDPAALAAAVRRLLQERQHYARASRAAGELLAARTWRDTAVDYVAVLDWVRSGRTGPMPRSSFAQTLLSGGNR
ncbi:Phosphatidylinositol alpha-mannosyltransferase [Micromonospora saelicesensis]|uniref:glycosyltransferase n=1 Tax=Micromonospora saelicesensis TaxID=285676 RepID=UPI000DC48E25|nr:glycosyltransferase [Micromonospora saelicesensis]RAO49275.1 Phosphatidylinositol alpha-mannosyltransferase [Micromonospora saelicesensis]